MARPPENEIARERVVSTRLNDHDFKLLTEARGDQPTAEWLRELIQKDVHR